MVDIAIVGEAYGEQEELLGKPFVGSAGQELDRQLLDAGIDRSKCFISNVFNLRPSGNKIETLFGKRTDPGISKRLPTYGKGLYLQEKYLVEIDRLYSELAELRPNIVILLGNTATWAILGNTAITKQRGTVAYSRYIDGLKVLPTFHPAAVLRQYELRHVTILDLIKARVESEFPEVRRPVRRVLLEPGLTDIEDFIREFADAPRIALDIETAFEQITCISFAPRKDLVLVIPFLDPRAPSGHYWRTVEEECRAWELVQEICDLPAEKVGQNVLYDTQFLWMKYRVRIRNLAHDTMLLHHSLFPESQKSLAFLGSVYTNEIAWKPMRPRGKNMERPEDE